MREPTARRGTDVTDGERSSPRGYRTAAPALLLLAALTALPAQTPAPDPGRPPKPTPPELRLQNLAPCARAEGVAVVGPFAPGAYGPTPDLHVPDTATAWQPFGARWPDGSVRQALCLFRAELPALGERTVALAAGAGPALPAGEVAMPAAKIELVA